MKMCTLQSWKETFLENVGPRTLCWVESVMTKPDFVVNIRKMDKTDRHMRNTKTGRWFVMMPDNMSSPYPLAVTATKHEALALCVSCNWKVTK